MAKHWNMLSGARFSAGSLILIPIPHVVGAADQDVPVAENTEIIVERYRKLGGSIDVISKPGGLHHPHSLDDPTPIVDFVLKATGQTK